PASHVYPPPVVRETPPPAPPIPGEPVVQAWRAEWSQATQPPPATSSPSIVAWGSPAPQPMESPPWAMQSGPAGVPPPFAIPIASGPIIQPTAPSSNHSTAGVRQTESLFILSLVLLNGLFNLLTYLLGPLGTWIRGPGRGMVGWAGILMIAAAAA